MWKRIEWGLLSAPIFLSGIGILSMASTMPSNYWIAQTVFLALGLLIAFICIFIDMKLIINYANLLFVLALLVTAGTLIFGVTINGANAWYKLFGFTFQPAEVLKIAFLCVMTRAYTMTTFYTLGTIVKSLCFYLAPVALILVLQNDIGTFLVFAAMWLFMTLILPFTTYYWKYILSLFFVGCIALVFAASYFLSGYQIQRLQSYPDHLFLKMNHHNEIGYQVDQSFVAIGSSSFWGKGITFGTQNQFGFLPEKHNDFIFASIIEEMGLFAAMILFGLYLFFVWKLYRVSQTCQQITVNLFCTGFFAILFFHIFQNIGMNIGLTPVTGISLPFVSYGGSFLLSSYLCVGMTLSFATHYKKHFFPS